MAKKQKPEAVIGEQGVPDEGTRRQIALLTAIIRIFRETPEVFKTTGGFLDFMFPK